MTEPAHILVVDDDTSIRRMLQLLLADAGYRISTAASGEEALAYLELVTPDLILLDYMLPGLNGREVAERIKNDPQRPFIPIILITARNDSTTKVSGLDAGADDFLTKPVEFAELLARVRALLRLQRSQRSLRAEQQKSELLLHLTRDLNTTLNLDDLLTHFLEKLADAMSAVRASLIMTTGNESRFYSSSRFYSTIDLQKILASGVAGWVLREQQPLRVVDTHNDERWLGDNGYHQVIRSAAAVPVMRDGRALGAITVVHHTPNHFTDEHIALLTSVAQQMAFTLANAELFQLTQHQNTLLERRAEELQQLNEIGRHLTELMQPEHLLRLVTHIVHYTFRYPQASILLRDDSQLNVWATVGNLVPEDENPTQSIPLTSGITGWVAMNRTALRVPDVRLDPRHAQLNASSKVRSELAVPIFAGRELYGVLDVMSEDVDAFSDDDEQLLGTLANQVGIALDNSRLFENEKRRVEQLDQVNQLSVAITAQFDRTKNLQITVDSLTQVFQIDHAAIVLYDAKSRKSTIVSTNNRSTIDRQLIADVLAQNDDGRNFAEPRIIDIASDPHLELLRPTLASSQISTIAIAPLLAGGETTGIVVLDISNTKQQFGSAELTLLATTASLIGQVVANIRLYHNVEDERSTLNAVLDGAADPILLIGPEERLLLANRAADQYLGIGTASGQELASTIKAPDLLAALHGRTNGSGPREITIDSGATFAISVAPIASADNGLLGRVAVLQDISAIKELERREQLRLRDALRRYVSPQVVEQVLSGDSDFGVPVERNVAVIFADLRGYTALTEGIEAQVLVEQVLNRYFTAMTEALYRHEGTIDKFLGDGLIGVFGTPIAHEDDLGRALTAAVDMQLAFQRLQTRWRRELDLEIGMGIGVGYGPAVVGNIGSTQRTDFTLIGDVVNTTSRLSGVAQAGQIIVSHQLIDALPATWDAPWTISDAGLVALKGKHAPHQIYTIAYQTNCVET